MRLLEGQHKPDGNPHYPNSSNDHSSGSVSFVAGNSRYHHQTANSGPPPLPGDGCTNSSDGGTNDYGGGTFSYVFPTNGLWMQINGITNGIVSLTLNNATDLVYEIWSTESLTKSLTNWTIEQEVWPVTNQTWTPFTVEVQDRTNNLFFGARDWTGITSDGNTVPEWWLWANFRTVDWPDTSLDSSGNTLLFDYQYGVDPGSNIIYFEVNVTNPYVNTRGATVQITVAGGVPSYMAALVDSMAYSNANWTPYNSNIVANLGGVQGWHTVSVGLRGFPADAQQTWNQIQIDLLTNPPMLVVTNPSIGVVTSPFIQLQGYCSENLTAMSYDLSNAAAFQPSQQALVTSRDFDTNTFEYTTNEFECFDIPLVVGTNIITLHGTDMAGNASATNLTYVLDPSAITNPPVINISWPENNASISGTNFPVRGTVNDPFATVTAQIVDNGATSGVTGLVEQNGSFWIENVRLGTGTNYLTITATNAAGYGSATNLVILQTPITLTITSVDFNDPSFPTATVDGTLSGSTDMVLVNGIQATNNGDGTWTACCVPVGIGGTASISVEAVAGGAQADGIEAAAGSGGAGGADAQMAQDVVRCSVNGLVEYRVNTQVQGVCGSGTWTSSYIWNWAYGLPGNWLWTECSSPPAPWYDYNYETWDCNGNATLTQTDTGGPCGEGPTSTSPCGLFYVVTGGYYPLQEINMQATFVQGPQCQAQEQQYVLSRATFRTGGQAVPWQENLWVINAYASTALLTAPSSTIPVNLLTLAGQPLDANGNVYLVLPNNSPPIDTTVRTTVTPGYNAGWGGFNEYQAQILANGSALDPVATNATFCVGQQITFTYQLVNLDTSQVFPCANASYNWTLPNPNQYFTSFTNNSAGCPIYTNNARVLGSKAPACWYVGGTGGSVTVGVYFQLPNGSYTTIPAIGQFAIYRPTLEGFTNDPPAMITNYGGYLSLGTGNIGGMSYEVDVLSSSAGCADILQLINRNGNSGAIPVTTSGQYWLDTCQFYLSGTSDPDNVRVVLVDEDTPLLFTDDPAIGLNYLYPIYTTSVSDQFVDYVAFRPGSRNANTNIYVTLGKAAWSWSGLTTWSNGQWSTPSGGVAWPSNFDSSDDFPQWFQVMQNTSN
ncbi:MAG: hypothetical protein ACLQU4_08675 [Limisphaerales bacterium]